MNWLISTVVVAAMSVPGLALADSSGSFSVFGPSAEREAFFANQRQERLELEDSLRKEALERERIAVQQQQIAAQKAVQPQTRVLRTLPADCWHVPVRRDATFIPRTRLPVGTTVTGHREPVYPQYVTRCVHLGRNETKVRLGYGNDGFTADARIRRPGLSVDLNFD